METPMRSSKRGHIIQEENGGSLVEFAIIAPLLFVILFGIIEFGIILYDQAVITNASREGARFGIVSRTPRHTQNEIGDVVVAYCNRLITFGTSNIPTIKVSSTDESVPPNGVTTDFGDDLKVEVDWSYTFLVLPNLPGIGLSNPLQLSASTVMKYE